MIKTEPIKLWGKCFGKAFNDKKYNHTAQNNGDMRHAAGTGHACVITTTTSFKACLNFRKKETWILTREAWLWPKAPEQASILDVYEFFLFHGISLQLRTNKQFLGFYKSVINGRSE